MSAYILIQVRRGFLTGFFLACSCLLSAQVIPGWKHSIKTSLNSINKANCLETGKAGIVYMAGTTWLSDSGKDILLIRYSATGDEEWRRVYDSPDHGNDVPIAMVTDVFDDVSITGISFDKNGNANILILKFSSEGNLLSENFFDGAAHLFDAPTSIASDSGGNLYVGGYTTTSDSGLNLILLRYDAQGKFSWKRTYGTKLMDVANAVETDDSDYVYVAGNCNGGTHTSDIIIQKYDPEGLKRWEYIYDGSFGENDAAFSMSLDDSANVYVTGFANHTHDRSDIPLIKLNRFGKLIKVKLYNGNISDCFATQLFTNEHGAYLSGFRTDYSSGASTTLAIQYDKGGNEKYFLKSGDDIRFMNFQVVDGNPLVSGNQLRHPESTLMPYIARPDSAGKLEWTFCDSTVYGIAHMVSCKISGNDVYFLGDDTGEATGTINLMKYTVIPETPKKKKSVNANPNKGGVQKN